MEPGDLPEAAGLDEELDAYASMARCVRPLLEALEPTYREALTRTALEGATVAAAAAEAGLSVSGMKSRVQRGRRAFRAALLSCCEVELDARERPSACC